MIIFSQVKGKKSYFKGRAIRNNLNTTQMSIQSALRLIDRYFQFKSSSTQAALSLQERAESASGMIRKALRMQFYPWRRQVLRGAAPLNTVRNGKNSYQVLNLASNDYLNMTQHPAIKRAAQETIETYGVGAGSVPLFAGTSDLHARLEEKLAAFTGYPAAMLFSSGFAANYGILSALLHKSDVAILDKAVHASLFEGCRQTNRRHFSHNDLGQLEKVLREVQQEYRNKMIVVDGVYSMDGDLAPLPQIMALARSYGAWVLVDDAHAFGLMGPNGRGTQAHFGLREQAQILTGSFGKGLVGVGGFAVMSQELRDQLEMNCKPYIYSTALPPSVAAALLAQLEILEREPALIEKLRQNIDFFRKALLERGIPLQPSSKSAIFPILIRDPIKTIFIGRELLQKGILTNAVIYPVVPKEQSRLRLSVTAMLSQQELAQAADILAQVLADFDLIDEVQAA